MAALPPMGAGMSSWTCKLPVVIGAMLVIDGDSIVS